MHRDVHKARDDMDQEEMARMVQRYDLVALPVVDADDRIVGVITVDDVLDVVEEEATEDILKLAGVGVKERALSPVRESMRRRLPWLMVNMCVALVAAGIVSLFEETIGKVAALAAIMPIVAGQGGNAGVQTSTIVVRGLALDEIDVSDLLRVLWKEILLGCVKGLFFGAALGVIAYVWLGDQNVTLALIAAVAMFANMIVASISGSTDPDDAPLWAEARSGDGRRRLRHDADGHHGVLHLPGSVDAAARSVDVSVGLRVASVEFLGGGCASIAFAGREPALRVGELITT